MDASPSTSSSIAQSVSTPAAPAAPMLQIVSTPPMTPRGTLTGSPPLTPRSAAASAASVAAAVAQTTGWPQANPSTMPPGAGRVDVGPAAARIDTGTVPAGSPTLTPRASVASHSSAAPGHTALTIGASVIQSARTPPPTPPVRVVSSPSRTPVAGPPDVPVLPLHQLSLQSNGTTSPRHPGAGSSIVVVSPTVMAASLTVVPPGNAPASSVEIAPASAGVPGSSITVAPGGGSSVTISAAQQPLMGSPSPPGQVASSAAVAHANAHAAAAAAARERSRASSAGAARGAAFPGLMVTPGRSTANSSGSSITGAGGVQRPRSAQSRMGAYTYLSGATGSHRIARGRAPVAAGPPPGTTHWSPRTGRAEKVATLGSPRAASPRGGSAVASHRVASPTALISSPAMSPPRRTSMSPRPGVREVLPGLAATWAELLELVNRSRPPFGMSSGTSSTAGGASVAESGGGRRENVPPDPWRTRRACQALASVVNRLPDDLLRRVFIVLAEELFNSIFRDYSFSYDPREELAGSGGGVAPVAMPGLPPDGGGGIRTSSPGRLVPPTSPVAAPRPPRLCEEALTNAVPYSAVVQSLRDAAKDAIMRRLELEAKCNCAGGTGGGEGAAAASDAGAPSEAQTRSSADGLRAGEEVQLREELRHARLLADTYQARTLELERVRIELEEEVRRCRQDRDRDDVRKQKITDEVRRLRHDTNTRSTRAAYGKAGAMQDDDVSALPHEQKLATPRISSKAQQQLSGGGGNRDAAIANRNVGTSRNTAANGANGHVGPPSSIGSTASSRRSLTDQRRAGAPPGASQLDTSNVESIDALPSPAAAAPSEEELPAVSRLRRNRTAGEVGVAAEAKNQNAARSLRTPRERADVRTSSAHSMAAHPHTSSGTSLLNTEPRQGTLSTGPADFAAGSGSRLRKSYGTSGSSATNLGAAGSSTSAGSSAGVNPGSPQSARAVAATSGVGCASNPAVRQTTRISGVSDWLSSKGWR